MLGVMKETGGKKTEYNTLTNLFSSVCMHLIMDRYGMRGTILTYTIVEQVFLKVDVEKCKELSREQKVTAMPTVKAYKEGVCVQTVQGALYDEIVAMIKNHV